MIGKMKEQEETEVPTVPPNKEQLTRRHALVPDQQSIQQDDARRETCSDNVIIVPHLKISSNDSKLFNRAISSGGGLLADLQRATIAMQIFYADGKEQSRTRSPWILRRLYEWSHRAKRREIIKHVQAALEVSGDPEFNDEELEKLLLVSWDKVFIVNTENLELLDRKRLQAVWELFHTELIFLHKQLLVLRNVYKEPLKKCQVEGCLLTVEPDLLFGNLDQICRISWSFCKSFLKILDEVAENNNYNTTDLIFSKAPSTISAYQAYCINYKATIEYLGSIREKEERFTEYERVCLTDPRCERLQLEDLLIAPLQHITRLPILLKEIHKYTKDNEDKRRIEKVVGNMTESLRSIDDSVQWLHNFERLQQLQNLVIWPSIVELETRTFIPEFLRIALSRQFCENLLVHPRRKLIHEGHLELIENGRTCDCYAFLFNDMFLLTKMKKCTRIKKGATQLTKSEQYVVQKQPIPLDSCVFCDADSSDSITSVSLKFAFVVIHLTRYYQVVSIFTLQATNKEDKELWIGKFQESIEKYESIQLKDMLKCTPLYSTLSLRRCSSSRLMQPNTRFCQNSSDVKSLHSDLQPERLADNAEVETEDQHCGSELMDDSVGVHNSVLSSDLQAIPLDVEIV
ncbi:unnamed protein product [Litomosoides sigmodontis]|uniref:DH domain-containing protein n=1 Tax=Litomosoides sigmodontis TaxID=42156 RepID=A0A3P6TKW2_LITSI|nr:unnamed protein product [Litomosoides sigmodontis]